MSEQHTAEIDAALMEAERVIREYADRRARTAYQPWFNPLMGAAARGRVDGLDKAADLVAALRTSVTSPAKSDRGAASLLAVCACLLVAISFAPDWWQRCFIAALFAFGIGCWVMARGAQRGAAIRDRLDDEAPKRWGA